jgi:hypothetical protein
MTTNNTSAVGHNSAGRLDQICEKLAELGRDSAKGDASLPAMAKRVCDGAFEGVVREGDVETLYDAYLDAKGKAAARAGLIQQDNPKSRNAQLSKLRQVIKAGALPGVNMPAVLERIKDVAKAARAAGVTLKGDYAGLVDVCRAQLKQPDDELTDEQITAAISAPQKASKDDLEKLCDIYKSAAKRLDAMPKLAALARAVDELRDAIIEAGGEVPALTSEEKERATALAYLRKNNLTAINLLAAE